MWKEPTAPSPAAATPRSRSSSGGVLSPSKSSKATPATRRRCLPGGQARSASASPAWSWWDGACSPQPASGGSRRRRGPALDHLPARPRHQETHRRQNGAPRPCDQRDLAEVQSDDFPGERQIRACRRCAAASGKSCPQVGSVRDEIGIRIGKVIDRYKVAKHFVRPARLQDQIEGGNSTASTGARGADHTGAYKSLRRARLPLPQIRDLKVRPHPPRSGSRPRPHPPRMLAYYVETCEKNSPPSCSRTMIPPAAPPWSNPNAHGPIAAPTDSDPCSPLSTFPPTPCGSSNTPNLPPQKRSSELLRVSVASAASYTVRGRRSS